MSSNFNFYVNRQGVQGVRGAKGEQGFSPVISVKTQTASEYVLQIENEDGTFDTPNLRGNAIENSGGTYIRFNPNTEEMYTGEADSATTDNSGVVRLSTYAELVAGNVEDAVPSAMDVHEFVENSIDSISGFVTTTDFNTYTTATDAALSSLSTNKLNASTFNSYTATTDAAIGALDTNKLDFTDLTNTLVQGSNVTLTTDALNKTITISATGGGGGGGSYTEGNGIDITNDAISVKVDGTTIDFDGSGNLTVIGGGGTQVQADWDESDPADPSYIQNKPTIPSGDNKSITTNLSGNLQTVGVIDQNNTSNAVKTWTGTKQQYTNLQNVDNDTIYYITDETSVANYDNSTLKVNLSGELYVDTSALTGVVKSSTVTNIVQITQADYDLLPTKDSGTLYVIVSSGS